MHRVSGYRTITRIADHDHEAGYVISGVGRMRSIARRTRSELSRGRYQGRRMSHVHRRIHRESKEAKMSWKGLGSSTVVIPRLADLRAEVQLGLSGKKHNPMKRHQAIQHEPASHTQNMDHNMLDFIKCKELIS